MGPRSTDLNRDDVAILRKIWDGDLHFVDRHKAERLLQAGLASITSDKHVLLTDHGKEYLRSVSRIGE